MARNESGKPGGEEGRGAKRPAGGAGRAGGAAATRDVSTDALFLALHSDHEEVIQLFEKLLTTDDKKRATELWTRGAIALLTHARAEQEVVYDRWSDDEELAEAADAALEEHEEIETLLLEANDLEIGTPPFRQKVTALAQLVRHHVTEEEEELIPKSMEYVPEEEREGLVARFIDRKDEIEPRIAIELTGPAARESDEDLDDSDLDDDLEMQTERPPPPSTKGATTKSSTKTPTKPRGQQAKPRGGGQDLDTRTVKELQELARKRGIDGRSRMKKEELIAALSKA